MKQLILSHQQIQQKIERLGHQIIENSFEEEIVFIGGISGNGIELANQLKSIIVNSSPQKVQVFEVKVNKDKPWSEPVTLDIDQSLLKNAYIILVDDVLNSGKTMQYSLIKILEQPTKAIKTVALVDRTHRRYPIKADFVGISLSTTLKERVEVELSAIDSHAYLL
ncbi:MAG: phosphoribosyltransferase family protein [Bacteroidota bacterium]